MDRYRFNRKPRMANPYRFPARLARELDAVTGGRVGLQQLDEIASDLGKLERKYLDPDRYGPSLFPPDTDPNGELGVFLGWGKLLAALAEMANSPTYCSAIRAHTAMGHELGCPRWAMALQAWWGTAKVEGDQRPLVLDLNHGLGHFRWEAIGNKAGWVSSRHFELIRSFGVLARELVG